MAKPRESIETLARPRTRRPPLYKVIFHNDDYTTRDFVVMVLEQYFHKGHTEATHIMLTVHRTGAAIAGLYPFDIAATKKQQVEMLARENQYPLRLSLEPETDDGRENGDGET